MNKTMLVLSKTELAKAFDCNVNTISGWMSKGLPYQKPAKGGAPCRFAWASVEQRR
jgi:phage terminase Nu1 subunit (DNA packaging protein)